MRTFDVVNRFYNKVLEGRINEKNFNAVLSPQELAKHKYRN